MSDQFVTNYVAVRAFFQALRREMTAKNPHVVCPIPPWEEIDGDAKFRFAKCMAFALEAAKPENIRRDAMLRGSSQS